MNLKLEEALLNLEKAVYSISQIEVKDDSLLYIMDKIENLTKVVYLYKEGEEQ